MLIECTFCKARAKLPESQEGAKVRCGACGKIYVARPAGSGRGSKSPSSGLRVGLIIGGALAVLFLVFMIMRGGSPPPPPPTVEKTKPAEVPLDQRVGWSSPPVLAVREIYEAVGAMNAARLAARIDSLALLAKVAAAEPEAGHPDPATATRLEADGWLSTYAEGMLKDEGEDGLMRWKPFEGSVLEERGNSATVRVEVDRRDPTQGMEARTYDWRLVSDGGRWKAAGWERFISESEKKAVVVARQREVQSVVLEDGSRLRIAEPRPLEHLADTPPELRAQIDAAFARMMDFELPPRENNKAQRELVAIGKPALPVLLTGLYQIRITDDETASKVNMIDIALKDITGHSTGYSPSVEMGRSDERREAAVKAWFGWWLDKGAKFQERKESEDALDKLIQPTERDLLEIKREKLKRKPGG